MSPAEFARRLGVDKSAVSLWLAGKSLPRLERLPKIAAVLGVSIEDLGVSLESLLAKKKRRAA